MSLTRIQEIVNSLSEQIGYSVAVTNYAMDLVSSSAQIGPMDRYRVEAVMQRRPQNEVIRLLREQSVLRRTEPFMFHPENLPGAQARMCVPLVDKGFPIAFVWIIVGAHRLDDEEMRKLHAAAAGMLRQLKSMQVEDVDDLLRDSQKLQDLITVDQLTAGYARTALVAEGIVDPERGAAVAVFNLEDNRDRTQRDSQGTYPLIHMRARMSWARHALLGLAEGHFVLVCTPDLASRLVSEAYEEITRVLPKGMRLRAIGTSSHNDPATGIRGTYEEAVFAARIAAVSTTVGPIADYSQLGAFIALRQLPYSEASVALLSPEIAELRRRNARTSVETLLAFLNCAGDIQRACNELSIHRTTLYYRLDRAREIVGDALDVGWRRTSIHLALLFGELVDAD